MPKDHGLTYLSCWHSYLTNLNLLKELIYFRFCACHSSCFLLTYYSSWLHLNQGLEALHTTARYSISIARHPLPIFRSLSLSHSCFSFNAPTSIIPQGCTWWAGVEHSERILSVSGDRSRKRVRIRDFEWESVILSDEMTADSRLCSVVWDNELLLYVLFCTDLYWTALHSVAPWCTSLYHLSSLSHSATSLQRSSSFTF